MLTQSIGRKSNNVVPEPQHFPACRGCRKGPIHSLVFSATVVLKLKKCHSGIWEQQNTSESKYKQNRSSLANHPSNLHTPVAFPVSLQSRWADLLFQSYTAGKWASETPVTGNISIETGNISKCLNSLTLASGCWSTWFSLKSRHECADCVPKTLPLPLHVFALATPFLMYSAYLARFPLLS